MRPEKGPRREFLASLAAGAIGLAGCTDRETGPEDGNTSTDGDTTTQEDAETAVATSDTTTSENGEPSDTGTGTTEENTPAETTNVSETLDRREANVVGVEFQAVDRGVRFDVRLHHDDDGEEGYANWWQVERLDGTQLGRRELLHAHANQPFTRSETIEVPDDVSCVVVRGHDQTHGYGGLAMLVSLDSGERKSVDQGSERQSFDVGQCP